MLVRFYVSAGKKFDIQLARHFRAGCRALGDGCEIVPITDFTQPLADTDVAVVVGVKGHSGTVFKTHRRAGVHAVFIDKGYTRIRGGLLGTLYFRVSLDDFQPLAYFQREARPAQRWESLGVEIKAVRSDGKHILLAGSSQKFCNWHDLGDATDYSAAVLRTLSCHTDRTLLYRPKPTWKDAQPVKGFCYSSPDNKFTEGLEKAYALVTYGSNACFEALTRGVPTLILGDGITKPLSATKPADIEKLRRPSLEEVYRLACDLAYCQWTLDEMAGGDCWQNLRLLLEN